MAVAAYKGKPLETSQQEHPMVKQYCTAAEHWPTVSSKAKHDTYKQTLNRT